MAALVRDTSNDGGDRFEDLTPREIVARLSEYIVGQQDAKRAIAVAIRNRLRRLRAPEELRDEIIPKNLILMGPTGVGKTEIARRISKLLKAPFVKVEATKFTEVGYVGRDVDSIVRDLTEVSVRMVRQEKMESVRDTLMGRVVDRLVDYLHPRPAARQTPPRRETESDEEYQQRLRGEEERYAQVTRVREKAREQLRSGELDEQPVTIDATESGQKLMQVFTSQGMEEMGMDLQNMFDSLSDKKKKKKRVTIGEAKRLLMQEEAERAIDMDSVVREAVERVELAGIVFIDEIDKIAHREGTSQHGPDVSREGVQRDILPLVEGTTVVTKYGPVRTQHILFIAAGAFHVSKVGDLIPEFQGRFPLRVELTSLSEDDFSRILREPKNSLIRQYSALLETEQVRLEFADEAVDAMAQLATEANRTSQNIGARRLHTVMEKLLEEVSFDAPYDDGARTIKIDKEYVTTRLAELVKDKDVAGYIL
ncbi:MAG TPA: ATP-dependent protease ATPase subunit HslU [Firmicutes bacterium]|nr:ATP-dependent protease ATPase subunit HslU [Bacillota bacterium]